MSVNAEDNNDRLFPVFRRQLSEGRVSFISTAEKLAQWLSSTKAYYPRARPQIIGLLETAHNAVLLAHGREVSFSALRQADPSNPWVNSFIKLLAVVYGHSQCFIEPDLRPRIDALIRATGVDASALMQLVRPLPRVQPSTSTNGSHPSRPTTMLTGSSGPSASASPNSSSSQFLSISARSFVSAPVPAALRVVTDLHQPAGRPTHPPSASTYASPASASVLPGPLQAWSPVQNATSPHPPDNAKVPTPGEIKIERPPSATDLALHVDSRPSSRSSSMSTRERRPSSVGSALSSTPATPAVPSSSSIAPLTSAKGKEKAISEETAAGVQPAAKPKVKAKIKPRRAAVDDEDFILADLEWFKGRAEGKQSATPETGLAARDASETTTQVPQTDNAIVIEAAGSAKPVGVPDAIDLIDATPDDVLGTTATERKVSETPDTMPVESTTATVVANASLVGMATTASASTPAITERTASPEMMSSPSKQTSPALSSKASPRRAFRMGTKGKRGRPPGLRLLPAIPPEDEAHSDITSVKDGSPNKHLAVLERQPVDDEVQSVNKPEIASAATQESVSPSDSKFTDAVVVESEPTPAQPREVVSVIPSGVEITHVDSAKDGDASAPSAPVVHRSPPKTQSSVPAATIAAEPAPQQDLLPHVQIADFPVGQADAASAATAEPVQEMSPTDVHMHDTELGGSTSHTVTDQTESLSRKRSLSAAHLSISPPKQRLRTETSAPQSGAAEPILLRLPQSITTAPSMSSSVSSMSNMDLETPAPSPSKQNADPIATLRSFPALPPPLSRTSSSSAMDLESRDSSPKKPNAVKIIGFPPAPATVDQPRLLAETSDAAGVASIERKAASPAPLPAMAEAEAEEDVNMHTRRLTPMEMEVGRLDQLVQSHQSPVIQTGPQSPREAGTQRIVTASDASSIQPQPPASGPGDTETIEHQNVALTAPAMTFKHTGEKQKGDSIRKSEQMSGIVASDIEDGEVLQPSTSQFHEASNTRNTSATAELGIGASTINGETRVIEVMPSSAGGSLFGPTFIIKICERGMPDASSREVKFELSREDLASLRRWTKRDVANEDLSTSKCLSLACYSFSDVVSELRANPGLDDFSPLLKRSSPVAWPRDYRLWIVVNDQPSMYISPPFLTYPDNLVDLSEIAVLGLNSVRFIQKGDYSQCVFVIALHHPTVHQLEDVHAQRQTTVAWENTLKKISSFERLKLLQTVS